MSLNATPKVISGTAVNPYGASTVNYNVLKLVASSEIQWEEPILFDEIETPEISASLLPAPLNKFAKVLALTSETPEALSVITILGVVASIISRIYVVSQGYLIKTVALLLSGTPLP